MSANNKLDWVVIYHVNCCDGIASLLIAKNAHKYLCACESVEGEFIAIPFQYKWKLTKEQLDQMYDRKVFILDFSFSPKDMDLIRQNASEVVMLDHHESAADQWGGYREAQEPGVELEMGDNPKDYRAPLMFKIDKCQAGAGLSYRYFRGLCKNKGNWMSEEMKATFEIFHPNTFEMAQCAEDRDLFHYILPRTREWHMLLDKAARGDERRLEELQAIMYGPKDQFEAKLAENTVLVKDYLNRCARYAKKVQQVNMLGVSVRVVNCASDFAGDTAAEIYRMYPHDPVILWTASTSMVYCSVRSGPAALLSAKALAEVFGGGGHEAAAAFTLGPKDLPALLSGKLKPNLWRWFMSWIKERSDTGKCLWVRIKKST